MNVRAAVALVALAALQVVAGPANAQLVSEFSAGIPGAPAPRGITVGPDNALWFTEETGGRVGRITTAGAVTEYSAGISPGAGPGAITAGPDGKLWFAERNINRIARIDPVTGVVDEYPITAGALPSSLVIGPDNNLWFTEFNGNKIGRMIVLSTNGTIGSFVEFPVPTAGSAPAGIVLGPDNNVWFTEFNGNKIGRIIALPANGTVGTITEFSANITAGSAPNGITVGADNNIWFTEINGNRIGKIIALPANGTVGTVTEYSSGITAASSPRNIVAGPNGDLWFTETTGNRIGQITTGGTVTEFPTPSQTAASPWGIVYGPDGNIWFTEYTASSIGQITPLGIVTEFNAGISKGAQPVGIAKGPDGNVWFTEYSTLVNAIGRITPAGVVTQFSAGMSANAGPFWIAAGPDGNMWFTEVLGNRIGQITPAGVVSEFSVGISPGAGLSVITAGPDGNMWFTEYTGHRIGRIIALPANGTVGTITEYDVTPGSGPSSIVAGPDGNMWFTEYDGNRIGRIVALPANGTVGTFAEFSVGITPGGQPNDITKGPDDNMWFTEDGGNRIGKIIALPANGTVGAIAEFSAGISPGASPNGITSGPDGNLWFTEYSGNRIGRITPAGSITTYGNGISTGSGLFGITAGPDGNLWFAETVGSRIGRLLMPASTYIVTNNNDTGPGSLRRAVDRANGDPGPNTITFDPAVTGTILLTSGGIQITGPLTITGPGPGLLTIDGNTNDRVFAVYDAGSYTCPALSGPTDYLVTISGLTLTNARRNADNSGGAIVSGHSLALDNMIIQNSMAKNGGGVAFFAQYPNQSLTINASQFLNNIAKPLSVVTSGHGGGGLKIGENCGGVQTAPVTVSVVNSLFLGNGAEPVTFSGIGGGIDFTGSYADITITDSTIANNRVVVPNPPVASQNYHGGGLRGTGKSLTIVRSQISGNSLIDATGADVTRGGGMHLYNSAPNLQGAADVFSVKIINSTISGNSSPSTSGAIHAFGNIAMEIDNSTITSNTSAAGRTGGVLMSTGATSPPSANNATTPTLTLVSSILANNQSDGSDLSSNLAAIPLLTVDANNSLIRNVCPLPSCNIVLSGTGNLTGVDPLLGPLANNGGPTRTHALIVGSPAIGAGSNPLSLTTDQRGIGFPRVVGGTVDMGAYEGSITAVAPVLQSRKSRKTHGGAGTFDLTLAP